MKMILGRSFVFQTNSMLPHQRQRSRKQKITKHELIGRRNKLQHLGPGDDEYTLEGKIFPGHIGTEGSLDDLAVLADQGLEHRLIDDQGVIRGKWMIDSITDVQNHFNNESQAREIDFKVKLRRSA